MSAKHRMKYTK